jgi:hypothetical protein
MKESNKCDNILVHIQRKKRLHKGEIWKEDESVLLRCDIASLISGSRQKFWTNESEENAILRNMWNSLPYDAVSYSRRKNFGYITLLNLHLKLFQHESRERITKYLEIKGDKLSKHDKRCRLSSWTLLWTLTFRWSGNWTLSMEPIFAVQGSKESPLLPR